MCGGLGSVSGLVGGASGDKGEPFVGPCSLTVSFRDGLQCAVEWVIVDVEALESVPWVLCGKGALGGELWENPSCRHMANCNAKKTCTKCHHF